MADPAGNPLGTADDRAARHPDDAVDRVRGTVGLVSDLRPPGVLHAAVARSLVPHGRVRAVDTEAARAAEGVVAVITGADLRARDDIAAERGAGTQDAAPVAIDRVRYVGEPVAIVVADSERRARAARDLVVVDVEELPQVTEATAALAGDAPLVHDDVPGNVCVSRTLERGDIDAAWDEAAHIHEDTYISPWASHTPMEAHVAVAEWSGGALEIWSATQSPYTVRRELADLFQLDESQVAVRTRNLGGSFGSKDGLKIEPLASVAARIVGAPVRLLLARDEVFFTAAKHAAEMRIRSGFSESGELVARDVDVVWNVGAYTGDSRFSVGQGLIRAAGPYRCPNVRITSTGVFTNTVPTGPFRGAMTSQVAWAYERQVDDVAAELGIDPLDLRRRNLLRDGDAPCTGEPVHDVHFIELLDDVAAAIDWDERPRAADRRVARGKGVALMMKSTITPSRSEADLRLRADGVVEVRASAVEMGQGTRRALARLAAEATGVELGRVAVCYADTSVTPYDTTTASSRTTFTMAAAITDAAEGLGRELAVLARETLGDEAAAVGEGLVVRTRDGGVAGHEILGKAGRDFVEARGVYQSSGGLSQLELPEAERRSVTAHWHQGAVGAEVEVDRETGRVTVLRCHGAAYAGRVIDEDRARQQNEGGIVFALGPALFEELLYVDGQLTNPNLSDYGIPSINDAPRDLTSAALVSEDPSAEIHGLGEMVVPAVAPAVGNAIRDALGACPNTLPLTAERVLRAVVDADEETRP